MDKKVYIVSFRRRSRDAKEEYEFYTPENSNMVASEWSNKNPNDFIVTWGDAEYPDDLEKSIKEKKKFWDQFKYI